MVRACAVANATKDFASHEPERSNCHQASPVVYPTQQGRRNGNFESWIKAFWSFAQQVQCIVHMWCNVVITQSLGWAPANRFPREWIIPILLRGLQFP